MSKVFSWKLNDKEYAYIFIPNKKEHLSERITDSDIINNMINKISAWDEKKYKTAFSQMNDEISSKYNFEIPYDSTYFNGSNEKKNIVLLGNSKSNEIENIKSELLSEIDKRFEQMLTEFNSLYNELLNKSNKQMLDSIKLTKEKQDETLNSLKVIKDDVTKRFNKAVDKFTKASKVLELDDNDINANSLRTLYKTVHDTKAWSDSVAGDIKTISKEYMDMYEGLDFEDKQKGVFNVLKGRLEDAKLSIDDVKNENRSLKKTMKILEDEQIKQKETKNEMVLGASNVSRDKMIKGDFSIKLEDDKILIENQKNQNYIILDNEGIKINGDVYINGNKI